MSGQDCLFCRIAAGELGTEFIYEDEHVVAFHDVNPQAPRHALVVPRKHVATVAELDDEALAGRILLAATSVAQKLELEAYRLVVNCGEEAGQSVFHIHVHVLGGRAMSWPPG